MRLLIVMDIWGDRKYPISQFGWHFQGGSKITCTWGVLWSPNETVCKFHSNLQIRDYLEKRLMEVFPENRIHFNGKFATSERIPNTSNFSILGPKLQGFRVLSLLKNTRASLGAACHADQQFTPSRILLALGIGEEIARNALRVSVGRETSIDDIDIVLDDLKQAVTCCFNQISCA